MVFLPQVSINHIRSGANNIPIYRIGLHFYEVDFR